MFRGKTTTTTFAAAVLAAVAFAAAGPSDASSSLPITSCGQTVTTNAVLTQDLTCAGVGIVVGASGITIDLKDHVLTGNYGDVGIRYNGAPVGSNVSRVNDDLTECAPSALC
jgi:hypothetical protein